MKTVIDINVSQRQDGVTPLHLACRYNSSDVTQYLLFRQADVNASDTKGRTPLHYATRRGNDLVTKVLLLGVADDRSRVHHKLRHSLGPMLKTLRSVCRRINPP